jgi:hypothetical protein
MMKFMLLEDMEALAQLVCRLVKVAAAASAAPACHLFEGSLWLPRVVRESQF